VPAAAAGAGAIAGPHEGGRRQAAPPPRHHRHHVQGGPGAARHHRPPAAGLSRTQRNTPMTKVRAMIGIFLAAALHAASLPARAADVEVKIDNFTFTPARITAKAGATITWINDDDIPHTIASSPRLFKSKALDTDDKYTFTFTTPGTYEYFCSLHPHMTGTIVIEAETGSDAATTPATVAGHGSAR